jgi:hypothetical protein
MIAAAPRLPGSDTTDARAASCREPGNLSGLSWGPAAVEHWVLSSPRKGVGGVLEITVGL